MGQWIIKTAWNGAIAIQIVEDLLSIMEYATLNLMVVMIISKIMVVFFFWSNSNSS